MGKICVECEDPSWTGQDPLVAPELPSDGGGVKVVDELPEKGQKGMAYVLVDDLDNPTSSQGIFVYDEGWLLTAQPVSEAVQEVDELPDEGQPGVLYYVPKTGNDTYDLYRWVDDDWIKVDTDIKLYGSTGQNTDGAMNQKAVTDAINNSAGQAKLLTKSNYGSGVQYIEAWKLPVGLYRVDNNGKRPSQTAFVHWRPSSNDTLTETKCNVFLVAVQAQNTSAKTIVGFYTGGGDSDGPYKITVFQTTAAGNLDYSYRMLSTQEIVDNLTSTETKKALSANQGKALNDKIGNLSALTTTDKTSAVAAINEIVTSIGNVEAALNAINNGGNA